MRSHILTLNYSFLFCRPSRREIGDGRHPSSAERSEGWVGVGDIRCVLLSLLPSGLQALPRAGSGGHGSTPRSPRRGRSAGSILGCFFRWLFPSMKPLEHAAHLHLLFVTVSLANGKLYFRFDGSIPVEPSCFCSGWKEVMNLVLFLGFCFLLPASGVCYFALK